MTSQPTTEMDMQTHTLDAPGATITYDVRAICPTARLHEVLAPI